MNTTTTTLEKRPIHMVDVLGQYKRYQQEIDNAILGVVRSGAYINGPAVKRFEREMAEYLQVPHAIACASGTDALQIALMALGVKPGDEIITTPFTFVATTETIALLGAKPVYVDIDPKTFNIDPEKITERITPRTKAILPVHLFGQPCDITRIKEIADAHHLYLIEDAAQVVGATWKGKKACGFGDIASISFYPSKNLGAFGDGGMMTAFDDEIAERLRSIANHGASRTYYHDRLGVNSRLDSVQAAILSVKLQYLDEWNVRRREIAAIYSDHFSLHADLIQTPYVDPHAVPIWHQYSIMLKSNRDLVMASLKAAGIPTNIYYPVPLHLQPAYQSYGGKKGDYPLSEYACEHILSLPMHSEMTDDDAAYIAENVIHHIRNRNQ
ncbi:MAG: DegT/DnrJ/EryC1/StrS family aminotransferase [Bacteroidota bacterium]|nr:DegT/DnrJ/EryC1/StrS family aminotransferase [Bacteroidota bacterium]MDP4228908.1 DegT/DnrJ/EryC1/StrS family aminotransferase [Bacteroidota bacterium]MDP4236104.1 DegT/DnrJ/EryC1/StrS family aminotransferase [Bacteroidota bacterium]